jgi:Nucleotidyl transferase AbiEii toxin, Type IV TA system
MDGRLRAVFSTASPFQRWLPAQFAQLPSFPIISAKQQFAEKLRAYTLPRGEHVNTRTKDLIDMVLLIRGEKLDKGKTADAVRVTFAKHSTHDLRHRRLRTGTCRINTLKRQLTWSMSRSGEKSWSSLFHAQCHHGVHLSGAPRRNIAGKQGRK